jgi:hypothetical protein
LFGELDILSLSFHLPRFATLLTMSEIPDWMQDTSSPASYDAEAPSMYDNNTSTTFAVPSPAKSNRTVGSVSNTSDNNDGVGNVSSMLMVEDDGQAPPREPGRCGRILRKMVHLVSIACLAFFGYALFLDVTGDGSRKLLWTLYYSASAAITCLFLLASLCCRSRCGTALHKFLVLVSILTIGFGGVMLYFSIGDYQDATEDKGDEFMEVIGAAVGVWSVFFHLIMWFCVREAPNQSGSGGGSSKGKVDKSDLKV